LRHLTNRHRAASAIVEDNGTNISSGLGAAVDKTKEEPKKESLNMRVARLTNTCC